MHSTRYWALFLLCVLGFMHNSFFSNFDYIDRAQSETDHDVQLSLRPSTLGNRGHLSYYCYLRNIRRERFFSVLGTFFDPGFLFPLAPSVFVRFPWNPARSIPELRIQCMAHLKYFHNVFHARYGEAPSFTLFTLPELERWSGSSKNLSGYSSRYILLHWIV
jgi:hypothetical protein